MFWCRLTCANAVFNTNTDTYNDDDDVSRFLEFQNC